MEIIESLAPELRSVVRGFCSHPLADALRPHITDHKQYSSTLPQPQTYPGAHTFYLYYFTEKKLSYIIATLKQIKDVTGADVRVSEWSLRPKLWPLYEDAFPNYFVPAEGQAIPHYMFRDENPWADSEEEEDEIFN